jgi:hypothetical protein
MASAAYKAITGALFGVTTSTAKTVENASKTVENASKAVEKVSEGAIHTGDTVVHATGAMSKTAEALKKGAAAGSAFTGYVATMIEERESAAIANKIMTEEKKKARLENFRIKTHKKLAKQANESEQQIKESENALKQQIQESENRLKLEMQNNDNNTDKNIEIKKLEHNAAMEALKAVQEQRVEIARIKATNELKNKQLMEEKEEIKLLNESNLSTSLIARKVNAIFFNEVCRAFGFQRSNKRYYYLGGEPPSSYFSSSTIFYFPTQCTILDNGTVQSGIRLFLEREKSTDKVPTPILKIIGTEYIIRPAYYFDHDEESGFPSTQDVFKRSKKNANEDGDENEIEIDNPDKNDEYVETLIDSITVKFTAFTTGKFSYPSAIRNIKGGKTRKKNKRKHNKRTKKNRKSKRNTRRRKK